MTFAEFVQHVRYWQDKQPQLVREFVESLPPGEVVDLPPGLTVNAVLAIARGERPMPSPGPVTKAPARKRKGGSKVGPAPAAKPAESVELVPDCKVELMGPAPEPPEPRVPTLRGRPSARAQALVRQQLKHGPRPEETVMAAASCADIPERAVIIAADALGVRTRKGQWWLPR